MSSTDEGVAVVDAIEEGSEGDSYEGIGEPTECFSCGGSYSWCSFCEDWTQTCCMDYGNCYCS